MVWPLQLTQIKAILLLLEQLCRGLDGVDDAVLRVEEEHDNPATEKDVKEDENEGDSGDEEKEEIHD